MSSADIYTASPTLPSVPYFLEAQLHRAVSQSLEKLSGVTAITVGKLVSGLTGQTELDETIWITLEKETQNERRFLQGPLRGAISRVLTEHQRSATLAEERETAWTEMPVDSQSAFYNLAEAALAKKRKVDIKALTPLYAQSGTWSTSTAGESLTLTSTAARIRYLNFHLGELSTSAIQKFIYRSIAMPNGEGDAEKPEVILLAPVERALSKANVTLYDPEREAESPNLDESSTPKKKKSKKKGDKNENNLQNQGNQFRIKLYMELLDYIREKWGSLTKSHQLESLRSFLASNGVTDTTAKLFEKNTLWPLVGGNTSVESSVISAQLGISESQVSTLVKEHLLPMQRRTDLLVDRAPFIQQAVELIFNNPHVKVLEEGHVVSVLKLALETVLNPEHTSVVSVGYGGSQDELQARLPAHMLGAVHLVKNILKLQEEMKAQGRKSNLSSPLSVAVPQLRLFSGQYSSYAANGFDPTTVVNQTEQMMALNMAYLKKYHPQVAAVTTCFIDSAEVYPEEEVTWLRDKLWKLNGTVRTTLERIFKMGKGHGEQGDAEEEQERSLRYAAAHPHFFAEVVDGDMNTGFKTLESGDLATRVAQPDAVLSFGGLPEKHFNRVRQALLRAARLCPERGEKRHFPMSIRFLQQTGVKPAYYADPEGDLSVTAVATGTAMVSMVSLSENVKRELKLLEADVQAFQRHLNPEDAWQDYIEFLKENDSVN